MRVSNNYRSRVSSRGFHPRCVSPWNHAIWRTSRCRKPLSAWVLNRPPSMPAFTAPTTASSPYVPARRNHGRAASLTVGLFSKYDADGHAHPGVDRVVQVIAIVHEEDVDIVAIQPLRRPRLHKTEGIAAVVEARISID